MEHYQAIHTKKDNKEQCKTLTLRSGKVLLPTHPNAPRNNAEWNENDEDEPRVERNFELDKLSVNILVTEAMEPRKVVNIIAQSMETQGDIPIKEKGNPTIARTINSRASTSYATRKQK